MNKTLVKTKIVLEDNGKSIVVYFWKKSFLVFGYWYPYGSTTSLSKIDDDKVKRINDTKLSEIIYEKFLRGLK